MYTRGRGYVSRTSKQFRAYVNYVAKMEKWLSKLDVNLIHCMYNNDKFGPNSENEINSQTNREKLEKWFGSVPKFSTFRVNYPLGSVDTAIEIIKRQLLEQAESRGRKSIPDVTQDNLLNDCVVVGCWDEQSMYFDRQPHEAIVDSKCGVAILRGADLFAPGVIAMSPDVEVGSKVSVYADLAQKCLWGRLKPYDDFENKMFVGNGIARMTRKEIFSGNTKDRKTGKAIEMTDVPSRISSFSLPTDQGILQNYPSILCTHVLNPQPGDTILDMCASPGNKTTHLASLMKGQGRLIALDKSKNKVEKLKLNCRLQGFDCVETYVCNSIEAVDKGVTSGIVKGPPPYPQNSFDKILLDAPCSALGQRPHINMTMTAKQVNSYPIVQRHLFETAVCLLKPGGFLVYSTCTILVQENEGLVEWALKTFKDIELVPSDPLVGSPGAEWSGTELTSFQRNCLQKFGPEVFSEQTNDHHGDTIGFFIAKFRKLPVR